MHIGNLPLSFLLPMENSVFSFTSNIMQHRSTGVAISPKPLPWGLMGVVGELA